MTEIPPGAPEVTGHLIIEPIMGPVSILKHQHHQPPLGHGLDKRRPGCEHIAAAVANGLPTAAWNAEQHV